MFTTAAEYYDLIYSALKDYPTEAAQLATLLGRFNPGCRTVLDVACGTGEHARLLAARGFVVDGVDLDPRFVHIAAQKHTAGRFVEGDMSDFDVSRRYDAVLCLFSSIGYLKTSERLRRAIACFRRHLEPNGVVIVEPWFPPGVLDTDRVSHNFAEADGVRVSRTTHVEVDGSLSRLVFDYEITDHGGTRHAREVHELGLFGHDELTEAFHHAGLELVLHDPTGLCGRGLYAATIADRQINR
jgi:SAM-dependent methyltransferase